MRMQFSTSRLLATVLAVCVVLALVRIYDRESALAATLFAAGLIGLAFTVRRSNVRTIFVEFVLACLGAFLFYLIGIPVRGANRHFVVADKDLPNVIVGAATGWLSGALIVRMLTGIYSRRSNVLTRVSDIPYKSHSVSDNSKTDNGSKRKLGDDTQSGSDGTQSGPERFMGNDE